MVQLKQASTKNLPYQYLRARFYDPEVGRFVGLDPFAGNANDPQSFHKYAYVHGDPIQGIDPTGEWLALAIGIGVGAGIGGFTAWTVGYDGWGIVTGALLGGALGGAAVAAAPLLPGSFFALPSAARGAAPTLVAGGLLGVWIYSEWAFGDEPSAANQQEIDAADQIIASTPGFSEYAERRKETTSWTFSAAGTGFDAYGYNPHFYGSRIYVSEELLSYTSDLFTASTIVHETQHSFQAPFWKSTWRGEQWAYQVQSDFLRANGVQGTVTEVHAQSGGTEVSFLIDLAESFEKYRIENPAITQ